MWSPCLPTSTSKRTHLEIAPRVQPVPLQEAERDQRGLRRILGADRDRLAAQVGEVRDPGVARTTRCDTPVAVGVAHGDGPAAAAGAALGVEPGQGRVPGDVDVPVEQRSDLQLVVGVEDDVDRTAVRRRRSRG